MTGSGSAVSGARLWLRLLLLWLLFAAALFVPAGTMRWPEAWLYLVLYLAWAVPVIRWLSRHNPALLRERMKGPIQRDQKGWDKVFTLASTPVSLGFLVVLGFDAMRFGWSDPPLGLQVVAFAVMVPCWMLLFAVMRSNAFLSRAVRIQEGHEVVTTGPYAVVRHPMYVAVIVLLAATPVALGALYALIPAGVLATLVVVRTALEDRTLHDELPGYREYAEEVRFRLLPGVW